MYFQNRYLANPAFAGFEDGLNLNLGYKQQFTSTPGSPKVQEFTADYNTGGNVGIGLNVFAEQTGLINTTRALATYAYHLPLSATEQLSFGLSLGVTDNYINYNSIVGDQGDLAVSRFNQRTIYFDGDFGIAYTGKQLTVQAAIPNLRSEFFKLNGENIQSDGTKFYTAISYKLPLSGDNRDLTFEPIAAYRGILDSPNVFDAGANLDLSEYKINLSGIYHTDNSATFGVGFKLDNLSALFAYSTNTSALKTYANNTFEIGLKLRFPGDKAK